MPHAPAFEFRIWIDQHSDALYVPTRVEERVTGLAYLEPSVPRTAAVEVLNKRDDRYEYGLLGARYTPARTKTGGIIVRAGVSEPDLEPHHHSLAGAHDDVRVGLPEEHAKAVVEASAISARDLLGPGAIAFGEAAHGLASSPAEFFARLALIILRLLDKGTADAEVHRKIIEVELQRRWANGLPQ